MKIVCPSCSAEYNIDDNRIPPEGMKATCPKCMTSWVVQVGQAAAAPRPVAAPVNIPAAAPVDAAPTSSLRQADVGIPKAATKPRVEPAEPDTEAEDVEEEVEEEEELEPIEVKILGRQVTLPNLRIIRKFANPKLVVPAIVGLVVFLVVIVQLVRFHKDLGRKGASWMKLDFGAIRLMDFVQADAPLKDDVTTTGNFQTHFTAGISGIFEDTFSGLQTAEAEFRKAAKIQKKNALAIAYVGEVQARLKEYFPENLDLLKTSKLRVERALRINPKLSDAARAKAELHLAEKNYVEATAAINQAIAWKPDQAVNYVTLGRTELAQGSTMQAQKDFEKAVSLDSKLASAHYYLGLVQEKAASYPAAQESFQKALGVVPGHTRSWLGLAKIKLDRFNLVDEAQALLLSELESHAKLASHQELALARYYLARTFVYQNKADEALKEVSVGRTLDPKNVLLVLLEAEIRQSKEPGFNAIEFVDGQVRDKTNPDYLLYKAKAAGLKRDWKSAIESLKTLTARDPTNARAYYELGVYYQEDQDSEKAVSAFEKTIQLDRGFGDGYVRLAKLKISKNQPDEALKLLEEVNSRNDRIASVHNLMGVIALQKNNLDKAKAEFNKAIEIDSKFVEAYRNLVRYHLAAKEMAAAEKLLKTALDLDPGGADTLLIAGEVYEAQGQYQQAVSMYEKIIEKDPKNLDALIAAGRAALGKKDNELALKFLGVALEREDSNPKVFYLVGMANLNSGNLEEASRMFQNAQRFEPKNPELYLRMGQVAMAGNQYNQAVTFLKEALALNPNYFDALGEIAGAYLRLNARKEAIAAYEKQIGLTQDNALKAEIYFNMAEAIRAESTDEALDYYQKSYALNKKNARALYGMGAIYEDNNEVPKALKVYQQAAKADPKYPLPYRQMGFIYQSQNQKAAALSAFSTYLRLDPKAKDKDEIKEQMSFLR